MTCRMGDLTREVPRDCAGDFSTELCGTDFAKSTVSDLSKHLDETVDTWNYGDLDKEYPLVQVDAIYIRVRRYDSSRGRMGRLQFRRAGEDGG